jgi:hypothetical protein
MYRWTWDVKQGLSEERKLRIYENTKPEERKSLSTRSCSKPGLFSVNLDYGNRPVVNKIRTYGYKIYFSLYNSDIFPLKPQYTVS